MTPTASPPTSRRRMTADPRRRVRAAIVAALASTGLLLVTAGSALATFPGRNGLIAFHSQTEAGTQIFTVRPDGNELRQITHVDGDAISADWSPDGHRIAFELDGSDGSAQVAVMNADGSDLVTLPGVGLFNGDPSFTPDGQRLVYGFFDGEHGGIASMNLDGTDQRVIRVDDFIEDPNVSPDGGTISVTCQQDPDVLQALCTMPVAGSALPALPNLTPFAAEVGAKSDWAPDGHQLVFTDHADLPNPGDSANVAVVSSDGTGERLLTHFAGGQDNAFAGSYSPDGRWIVFRREDHGQFALMRMRPDGSHLHTILALSDLAPRFIDWGPRPDNDDNGDDRDDD